MNNITDDIHVQQQIIATELQASDQTQTHTESDWDKHVCKHPPSLNENNKQKHSGHKGQI